MPYPRRKRVGNGAFVVTHLKGNVMADTQAMTDFKAAVAAEDNLIDQAVAFIQGVPAVVQAAIDLAKQTQSAANDAALAQLQADVQAHSDAITAALPATPPVI